MAGEQHVVAGRQAAEHVILNHVVRLVFKEQIAFVLVDVHTERADFLLLQRVDGGGRVDQRAAAGVDHHYAVFHHREGVGIQQMVVFRRQRAVQGNHVGLRVQRFQVDILRAQRQRLFARERIVGQQLHAEAFQNAHRRHADFTGADHAGGAVVHVKTDQPFQREVGVASALISAVNTAVQAHHHAYRVFCHGLRRVGRHAHHLDAQFFGGVQIDVIKTGAAQGEDLDAQCRQFFEHFTAAVVVDEDTHRLATGGRFGGFFAE